MAAMGFHHVAIAAKDIDATHRFYTEAMGFALVHAETVPTDSGGWAKHAFYDAGEGTMLAFWDLHDERIGTEWPSAISEGLGLPIWVNHLAFKADTPDALEAAKQRWLDAGLDVVEIDHGWCRSMYTNDPNGVLVEWCHGTPPPGSAADALAVLRDPAPAVPSTGPEPVFHSPARR